MTEDHFPQFFTFHLCNGRRLKEGVWVTPVPSWCHTYIHPAHDVTTFASSLTSPSAAPVTSQLHNFNYPLTATSILPLELASWWARRFKVATRPELEQNIRRPQSCVSSKTRRRRGGVKGRSHETEVCKARERIQGFSLPMRT